MAVLKPAILPTGRLSVTQAWCLPYLATMQMWQGRTPWREWRIRNSSDQDCMGHILGEYDWNGDPPQGTLSQAVATVPGQQYKVSFWLTSVDSGGTTSPNNFSASWDGSVLFAQTNLSAFDWTNMQFVVPATSHSSTLEFQFNNEPAAFGLDDVSVEVSGFVPIFQSVIMSSNTVELTWSGVTNFTYQVQTTSDLSNPNWTSVPGAVTVTNGIATVFEPVVSPTMQFYRVVQLPAQ